MILVAAALLLVLQNPAQQKASMEGFVVRAGTNEPVSRARVTITRTGSPGSPVQLTTSSTISPVTTDSQGYFRFSDLTPGPYSLVVQRNGFARQAYGERAPGRGGTPLNLAAGQAMKDIVFRLIPAGTVTGRVLDSTGEPLSSINVQLLKPTYDGNGQRRFQTVGSARTNDRGEYRIFWVTPGRYFVSATPNRSPINALPVAPTSNEVTEPGYAITYYPGTTDLSTASAIEIQPAAELSAIDFTMTQQSLFRVRGRVLDSRTGQSPRNASVNISARNPSATGALLFFLGVNSYNNASGTFEFRDIPAGSYIVRADAPITPTSTDFNQRNSGQITVDVSRDVDNLLITFAPGVSIAGRLTIEGGAALSSLPDYDRLRVFLNSISPEGLFAPGTNAAVSADGSFKLDNIPLGDYRVVVPIMPAGMYLKEARVGQTDVVNTLSVAGPLQGPLEILISPNAGQIDGAIVDNDRHPVPGIQAVLIPDRLRDRRDLYKTAISDQNGHFTIRSIVPGDYKLFAWEDLEPFAYNDPDILRKYEERGTTVKISESSMMNIEVKVIPAN
jgi:protocatechuate 3,4-dioxygenase beta subunit